MTTANTLVPVSPYAKWDYNLKRQKEEMVLVMERQSFKTTTYQFIRAIYFGRGE